MDVKNLFETLSTTQLDPAVGIRVAPLSGDGGFTLFGAEIAPGTRLSAHFHREGNEIYYILAGSGRMNLGRMKGQESVAWAEPFEVRAGDCFTVKPGMVHQLHNTGSETMNALFACSPTHLTTDRTVLP
jgi:mannose-6-phosphate isomerase-like protein (cupin superfamily)